MSNRFAVYFWYVTSSVLKRLIRVNWPTREQCIGEPKLAPLVSLSREWSCLLILARSRLLILPQSHILFHHLCLQFLITQEKDLLFGGSRFFGTLSQKREISLIIVWWLGGNDSCSMHLHMQIKKVQLRVKSHHGTESTQLQARSSFQKHSKQ